MFEYAALVDAPVQRFTGIVTGTDPLDEIAPALPAPVPTAIATMPAPEPMPMAEPMYAAPEPLPPAPASVLIDEVPVATMRTSQPPQPRPHVASLPTPSRRSARVAEPVRKPALVPALLAVAAAGFTAMWWLRRDSHDRLR